MKDLLVDAESQVAEAHTSQSPEVAKIYYNTHIFIYIQNIFE